MSQLGSPSSAIMGFKIYTIPDPPHRIKNLPTNWRDKDIRFTLNDRQCTATWNHIRLLLGVDSSHALRAVPKLTHDHNDHPRAKQMKVIIACRILNHSCAAGTRFYVQQGLLPPEAEQTAMFVEKVNRMWDFVDSHNMDTPVGKKPVQHSTLQDDMQQFNHFYEFVTSWTFIKQNDQIATPPSHKRWMLALKGSKLLSYELIIEKHL